MNRIGYLLGDLIVSVYNNIILKSFTMSGAVAAVIIAFGKNLPRLWKYTARGTTDRIAAQEYALKL